MASSSIFNRTYPAQKDSSHKKDDGEDASYDQIPGDYWLARAAWKVNTLIKHQIIIPFLLSLTTSVHQGATCVDHTGLEGVNEGSVRVETAHDDHDQPEDDPDHD